MIFHQVQGMEFLKNCSSFGANDELERSQGMPNVIGAIDGHIPIKQPVGNAIDFYNENNSILLYYRVS